MRSEHSIALRHVPAGKRVRIHDCCTNPALRGRLCALGITPGTEVDVCSQGHACCLRVRDTSLVLGAQMAEQVLCEPLDDLPDELEAVPPSAPLL